MDSLFQKMVLVKLDIHIQENEAGTISHHTQRLIQNRSDLNVRPKTASTRRKQEMFQNSDLGKNTLDMTRKTMAKAKTEK